MYSQEQRKLAIETYIELDYSIADTVATLGFPNRHTLSTWWKEYESTGEIPVGKNRHRESMYSDRQARAAANHYLEHGKSVRCAERACRSGEWKYSRACGGHGAVAGNDFFGAAGPQRVARSGGFRKRRDD